MPSTESINTQFQGAFVKLSEGDYALRTSGSISGSSSPIQVTIPVATEVTSSTANGKVTTPGADANIAATANLVAGTWDIEIWTFIGGTTVANLEVDNMKFKIGNTAIATILNPVAGTTGATGLGVYRIRVDIPNAAPISVASGVVATTGAVYTASIVATRIS
ncbi:hypothetical protein [Streptomyces hebeiensis]